MPWMTRIVILLLLAMPGWGMDSSLGNEGRHSQGGSSSQASQNTAPQQRQLVDILIEMQKKTEEEAGIQHTLEEEADVDVMFEDDIVLTVEQARLMLREEGSRGHRRVKRKLATKLERRWTLPIPYLFDGTHSETEKRVIKDALSYWEDLTCIKFREDHTAENKLMFTRGHGCWSYVGYTKQINQTISIGPGCQSNGTIAHEVGHAVGFWHEQSRPDRDDYVWIHEYNVTRGKLYNFLKRTWGEVMTLDIPYDLGSDMHYGSKFYAKDGNNSDTTVQTHDPLMSRVIGQRQELSFYDVKLANMAYCQVLCSSYNVRLAQPCQREGYQDPNACHRCRCPEGFGGIYCDTVSSSVNAYCGGVVDARYNGSILSPGYLSPGYSSNVQCSWLIRGLPGSHVYLQFVGDFGVAAHLDVCKDYVEVRYNTSLALTGARFCCTDPPRRPIRSDTHEMLVLFRTFPESRVCDDKVYPWKCRISFTGFKARYYMSPCGGCHGNYASQPACKKRDRYTCRQTWQETVTSYCTWWNPNCQHQTSTVNKSRYATCFRDTPYCCENYSVDRTGAYCIANSGPSARKRAPRPPVADSPVRLPPPGGVHRPQQRPLVVWSDWSNWSLCPAKCGGATIIRTRMCLAQQYCTGSREQRDIRPCASEPCYNLCRRTKTFICGDYWRRCTKQVLERCNPYCNAGFNLQSVHCL